MVKIDLVALVAAVVLGPPAGVLCIPQQPQPSPSASPPVRGPPWAFLDAYPRQYITHRLQPGEHIEIDGKLDEPAWTAVNWTEPMEDIAQVPAAASLSLSLSLSLSPLCQVPDRCTVQSFYEGLSIPESYATLMKVRVRHCVYGTVYVTLWRHAALYMSWRRACV